MRSIRPLASVYLCFVLVLPTSAQQTTTQAPQASLFLQSALAALAGANRVTDVTLTGTARRIAGSDDETGTAMLKAILGASRLDLSFPSGARSEVQNTSGGTPTGTWSGPDGISHPISYHNLLLIDPGWFFPIFLVSRGLATGYAATYIGHETRSGQAVEHLSISQPPAIQLPAGAPDIAHLTQMDFFLDSTTFLPAALTFNIHPDDNELLDIPIEARFSDYRPVNGVQVPFHVQKFLNNGLILDLQFQSAILNSGIPASAFQVP